MKKVILIVLATITSLTAVAQPPRFSVERFINEKGYTLNYFMLYPDADTMRRYPLVIFLHVSGSVDMVQALMKAGANPGLHNFLKQATFHGSEHTAMSLRWNGYSDKENDQLTVIMCDWHKVYAGLCS